MNIIIEIFSKKIDNHAILIASIKAMLDGKIKKEQFVKEIKEINKIHDFSKDIINSFTKINSSFNFEIYSNVEEIDNLELIDVFQVESIKELDSIEFEAKHQSEIEDMETYMETDMNLSVPDYINKVEMKDIFKKNALLFMIATYFSSNESHIFDFPMFLELKKTGEIDSDMMVEEFIESILEKISEII